MSSCAASCFTCFRMASCASVTSASWPTGNALRSCHYASAYSRVQQKTYSQSHRLLPIVRTLPHSGTARFAVGLCTSSSGSPRLNFFYFARHPILDYVRHETHLHPRPVHLLRHTRSHCVSSGSDYPRLHLFATYLAQEHEACRHISHCLRPAQPVTLTPQTSRPSSDLCKVHRLPPAGAASFKSLYPKRPFKHC